MIHMRLDKNVDPFTDKEFFVLMVSDMGLNLAEALIVDKCTTIEELVGGLRKLADRLEFPHD